MKNKKIFIAGHNGMVGSAIYKDLKKSGYENLITKERAELDLTKQIDTYNFLSISKPDVIIVCAAKVGGILANNNYRAEFIHNNLQISSNLIHGAHLSGVQKLIFLGSSCIYPKEAKQPIKEEYLLDGPLEYTNEPYAIAKIAALKMCESYSKQYGRDYYSVMPCNLFGPNDNFDLETSHVLPALIRKAVDAKLKDSKFIEVWGSGNPLREFLYTPDLAKAVKLCMEKVEAKMLFKNQVSHINIGSDDEVSIKQLAKLICEIVGFKGEIVFDASKPDGTMRKKMDNSLIKKLGFKQEFNLKTALEDLVKKYTQTRHSNDFQYIPLTKI